MMIEVTLSEGAGIEQAIKAFRRKVQRSGILKEVRQRRHHVKPSTARRLKAAAAQRRKRKKPRPRIA